MAGQANACSVEKLATLPITFNDFMPTVPVLINGRPVHMGVDTGAQNTVITPDMAKALGLPQDARHRTNVIGTDGVDQVHNVFVDNMEIGGMQYVMRSIAVIPLIHESHPGRKTPPMAGLIGTDILADYDVELDMPGRTMTFYAVAGCSEIEPPWQGEFARVPVSLTRSQRLAVPITVDGQQGTAIFDTGASGLRMALASAGHFGVTDDMLQNDRRGENSGVGGHVRVVPVHQFDSVAIERETTHDPAIAIVDFPASEADMLIGEDYMRAHRFWLSYATKTLFIQRLASERILTNKSKD